MDRRTFIKALVVSPLAPGPTKDAAVAAGAVTWHEPARSMKTLIAHRGASAYAPENTLSAYRLAVQQGADLVEQDLQITKDGVLVCLHDRSLEATTNVADVFPGRFTVVTSRGRKLKQWLVHDFSLAEIKQLSCRPRGGEIERGVTVPTWQEVIEELRDAAGLCPETKMSSRYDALGFEMEKLVADVLKHNGLATRRADSRMPVLLQSFSKKSLMRLQEAGARQPMMWLGSAASWTPEKLAEASRMECCAIGPAKDGITRELVAAAHAAGLRVIPYTFNAANTGKQFAGVRAEMRHYLYDLGVDGLFTDNPDLFPRTHP